MSSPPLPCDFDYLPRRVQQCIQDWNQHVPDASLLDRSLDTPDWTLDQLWQAGVYYHLRLGFPEALRYYFRLLQWTEHLPLQQADALQAIGHVFLLSRQHHEAERTFMAALKLDPQPILYLFIADCLLELQKPLKAITAYQKFLELSQERNNLTAHAASRLANLFDQLGETKAVLNILVQAAEEHQSWGFAFQAQNYLPLLPIQAPLPSPQVREDFSKAQYEAFFSWLPYRQAWRLQDPLEFLKASGETVQAKMQADFKHPDRLQAAQSQRIVVVGNFAHPEAEAYYDILIELSRKYSLSLMSVHSLPDYLKQEDWLKMTQLPPHPVSVYHAIRNRAPDLLIYLDAGHNNSLSYLLASLRLAPVQALMGTQALSSGLTSLDYFLSFDWLETPAADQHYSEKLIRLQGMPHKTVNLPERFIERQEFNLPADKHTYFCPVPCISLHQDFIPTLAEILKLDPEGQILIPRYAQAIDQRFISQFRQSYPDVAERLYLLPDLGQRAVLSLIREVDLILDPHFMGLSYSLWRLLLLGTPIVTWPSERATGRFAASLYRELELEESIAAERQQYAPLAVRLAEDKTLKERFRSHIENNKRKIFQHQAYQSSLEAFIQMALQQSQERSQAQAAEA